MGLNRAFLVYSNGDGLDQTEHTTHGASLPEQLAWMHALRAQTTHIEFVFNNGDDGHPLLSELAHLECSRSVGVEEGNGYSRPRPAAIKRRYAYDRHIIRAIEAFGGFFPDERSSEQWPEMGDVDVVFRDQRGHTLGATVAHEAILLGT